MVQTRPVDYEQITETMTFDIPAHAVRLRSFRARHRM